MADEPKKHLVYVSRLSQVEKDQIYNTADVWSDESLRLRLQKTIGDVCLDRLIRADGCLQVARHLSDPASGDLGQEGLRTAIGRSYYSIHHSIRAMCLCRNEWDPDSHTKCVEELKKLVGGADFQQDSGLTLDIIKAVGEARGNREVADYSPYDFSRRAGDIGLIPITDNDWKKAAEFNIRLAEQMLAAATRVTFK